MRIFTNFATPCFSPDARVIVVPRSDRAVSMHRALPLLLLSLALAARAGEVAQFRAEDFGADWRATRGGAVLRAVHPATNGWGASFADRGGVSFAGTNGVASPLGFDPATTGAVARALVVADCAEARPWSALLDAPVGAALAPRAFDWQFARFATSNCLGVVAVSVDGVAGAAMPTNGTPHLVEVVFPEPVAASELYLGGHPATPTWNRAWRGRVFEALSASANRLRPTRTPSARIFRCAGRSGFPSRIRRTSPLGSARSASIPAHSTRPS